MAVERSPTEREPTPEEWRRFESHVASLHTEYEAVSVQQDYRVLGRHSGIERQVDVWIEGDVAGHRVTLAVECKAYNTQKVGIGMVDAFCGFLQDVGADRGVMYTTSVFTQGARSRAAGHGHTLLFDEEHIPSPEEQRAVLEPDWCPNCDFGEVHYTPCDGGEYGSCGRCGATYLRCGNCGDQIDFDHGELECFGCSATWHVSWHPRELETVTQTREGD